MKSHSKVAIALVSLFGALTAGSAMAAGVVSGITTDKMAIDLGQSLNATVNGTINKDAFKKGCQVRIVLHYADNTTETPHPGFLVDAFPAAGFYLKPTKPGVVKVVAEGGGTNNLGWPACTGSAQAQIQVKAPIVVDPHPVIQVQPTAPVRASSAVISLPAVQAATLTSIKQVQYTDHSGETWIEVNGTGNCSFNIDGAGLPPSSFSSSAAKPFPMKVKINNAPLGSHQWKAKGTGTCTGEASTTFSVD